MKQTGAIFTRKFGLSLMYGVLFVLLSVGVYVIVIKVFALREIKVVGGNIQVSVNEQRFPHTLLFFPSDRLRTEILADNPALLDIRFEKRYPHTLLIVPTLRAPAALLITPSRRVLVSESGIVLTDVDTVPGGLPQIFASVSGLRIGQQVSDTGIAASLSFLSAIQGTLPIETILIQDDGAIRAHTGNLDILFTQNTNAPVIASTLQTLLAGFRIKGTLPTVIDLRFDKPVVTF